MLEILLRATAWASLVGWGASEWLRSTRPSSEAAARASLTAGGLALLVHSALAFHVRYAWSQDAAIVDTERQTLAVTGLAVGAGLYVNYLFLAVWLLEIGWWWREPVSYGARARGLDWIVRGFFMFMFVNGAFVFVHGPLRLFGAVALLAVAWAWYRRWRGQGVVHA